MTTCARMTRHVVLVVTAAVITMAFGSADLARAGTFEVSACDAAPGLANNSWRPEVTHGGMLTYLACPAGDNARFGLGARHQEQPSGYTVPSGAAARWWFDAPPGTAVVGIRANALFEQFHHGWQVGLSNGSQLLEGCPSTGTSTGGVCVGSMFAADYRPVPPSRVLYTEVFCAIGPCPAGGAGKFWARGSLTYAVVTVADDIPPTLGNVGGDLWTDRWVAGTRQLNFDASDNTGIKQVRVLLDGLERAGASRGCDGTAKTCPDWPGAVLSIATGDRIADGRHTVTIQAVDRADNPVAVSRDVHIDNTPPAAPQEAAIVDGDGWRSTAKFDVQWKNPPQATAPIGGVDFKLCPANGDERRCISGRRDGRDLARISGLQPPQAGDWLLTLWLRDEAGNSSPSTAAPPLHLRFDPTPPDVSIRPTDPEDPARLRVAASDDVSGVARGEIEIRRRGARAWRALAVEREPGGFAALVDDEHLADGVYELRARTWDAAGNERSTDRLTTGEPAQLTLPVRVETRLRVGKTRRVRVRSARNGRPRTRTIYVTRPVLPNGRRVRLRGRLTAPGGNALQGVTVEVAARTDLAGAAFQPVATLTTSRTGRFTYLVPVGPSRVLRFHYPGAPKIRPQTRDVEVQVRASSSMHANRRSVVNGEAVTFSGGLRGGGIPADGKLVELQFFDRGKWRTFRTFRAASSNGRWSYTYRFDGTRGTRRYRFRVKIPRESGYPFAPGASSATRVTVRGL
jgi:hypothetical protein